ncbi:phosphoglycolate phosphatase [Sinimarinibacterium sp. CAU 1509]|uniref:phosphoglycolate phosphatase n=1 Tax=Sinimarinibacterium sp. CAU 1509 TaxID=2562283 RepID=UPI0010AB96F5|nr:phosphoglycolate phosphatase [Sinimarinibacterium sp. CAU 1509]TJY62202.1 phosphoglycolate phosphatase [Sinimarinibacterium sp. CAU 1509]
MTASKPLRCVLFDLDGTLVDTAPDLGHAANHVRANLGLPALPLADYRPVASAGARGLLQTALGMAPEHPEYSQRREELLNYYSAHLADESTLFDGIDTLLEAIGAAGLRWGVVTNKPSWLTRPLMTALALDSAAACVVSADEATHAKPHPASLLLACERIDLEPQACLYVGDDLRDIQAGRAAGMRTIAAGWGYVGYGSPIGSWGADGIVEMPTGLLKWIPSHA